MSTPTSAPMPAIAASHAQNGTVTRSPPRSAGPQVERTDPNVRFAPLVAYRRSSPGRAHPRPGPGVSEVDHSPHGSACPDGAAPPHGHAGGGPDGRPPHTG